MIYPYKCKACGAGSEISCKLGWAKSFIECPHCGGVAIRDFNGTGIMTKGFFEINKGG